MVLNLFSLKYSGMVSPVSCNCFSWAKPSNAIFRRPPTSVVLRAWDAHYAQLNHKPFYPIASFYRHIICRHALGTHADAPFSAGIDVINRSSGDRLWITIRSQSPDGWDDNNGPWSEVYVGADQNQTETRVQLLECLCTLKVSVISGEASGYLS